MIHDNAEIIQELARLQEGWVSSMQLAFDVGGDDIDYRRSVRGTIAALVRAGSLERIWVLHRDQQLEAVYLDRNALEAALNNVVSA